MRTCWARSRAASGRRWSESTSPRFPNRTGSPNAAGEIVGSRPRIGVLALQGDVADHRAALSQCGADTVAVRTVEELDSVDGLVLPGGESTTMSCLLQVFDLLDPL